MFKQQSQNVAVKNPPRRKAAVAVLAALMGATLSAHAAAVTFGPATTISGDSDVNGTLTLVSAFNVGPGATTTVNGVAFQTLGVSGTGSTGGTYGTGEGAITLAFGGSTHGYGTFTSTATPFSSLSSSYQALVGTAGYANGASSLTLNGLTIGKQYQLELWSCFSTGSGNTIVSSTGGNSITLNENTGTNPGGLGQFTIGTFTASAATQAITLTPSGGSGYILLSGVELNAVPEPSVWALVLASFSGIFLFVRRRRRLAA